MMPSRRFGGFLVVLLTLMLFAISACSPGEDESLKGLLLSEEFDQLPEIGRDDLYGEPLLHFGYEDDPQFSDQDREQRIAKYSEGLHPAECWVVESSRSDIWISTGVVPIRSASVLAMTKEILRIDEEVALYEDPEAVDELLLQINSSINTCAEFTSTGSESADSEPVVESTVDRTSELDLADTIAYTDGWGNWYSVSGSGRYFMRFFVQVGVEVDPATLITSAVNKFRDGVEAIEAGQAG